jgi:cysteine desulfurase
VDHQLGLNFDYSFTALQEFRVRQIYLDYNATTPIAPSVVEAMQPFFAGHYGNPSSAHSLGRAAHEAIEDSRVKVAGMLGCDRNEIVFTSGGTEANNLAIKGVMCLGEGPPKGHLVVSAIEHPAVSEPAMFMRKLGCDVTVVPCDENGYVRPSEIAGAIRANTRLVSVMHANNEVGTIQPIRQIAELCHQKSILVHTDASQTVGKLPTFVDQLDVDMLTVAGHKFYGPKGVGVLFVRDGVRLDPLLHGAAHEGGRRGGTENTPYIVGLGQACHLAAGALDDSAAQMNRLRDRMWEGLSEKILGIRLNGAGAKRLPNTLSVNFPDCSGQELLRRVPEICASTGSACHSTGVVHSATLEAMGLSPDQTAGTVRLSVGWYTSEEEVERAIELLVGAWESISIA